MTEQGAREKWCPMARVDGSNRRFQTEKKYSTEKYKSIPYCIASDCAMWVWEYSRPELQQEEWEGNCGLIRGNK